MEENSLKLHGKERILGMLRLALIPASPGLVRRSARQVQNIFGKLNSTLVSTMWRTIIS
jgi:hypothetical protein